MFYSDEKIKELGYSSPWAFLEDFKKFFPEQYQGCHVTTKGIEIHSELNITNMKKKQPPIIRAEIFDQNGCEQDLANFLNEKKITRDRIISISMSSDSDAPRRFGKYGIDRILLVWEEER